MKSRADVLPLRGYEQTARAKSAQETASRIVDAFIARVMTQWYDEITLDAIAADAGVTVQTILRRFNGKEGLFAEAVKVMASRINAKRLMPGNDIGAIVDKLFADYEETGDSVIRLLALEGRYAGVKAVTDFGRGEHRQWITDALTPRLTSLTPAVRERLIDALVIATDVYTWKLLRRDMGRSVAAAKTTMKSLIRAGIAEITNAK